MQKSAASLYPDFQEYKAAAGRVHEGCYCIPVSGGKENINTPLLIKKGNEFSYRQLSMHMEEKNCPIPCGNISGAALKWGEIHVDYPEQTALLF